MKRLPRWLGSLLSPAEDPRRGGAEASAPPADPRALLASLQSSRAELTRLGESLETNSPLAAELQAEEEALLEAERSLVSSMDEQRARAALLKARRRAIEAELLADL